MNLFFRHFDLLAETPNGIKKLRDMILQWAVMGKLVPQDPEDEPASVLLEKIKQEKEQLIKEGKLGNRKPLPHILEKEKPFLIPNSWKWTRLGEITNYGFCEKTEKLAVPNNTWVLELEDIEKVTSKIKKKIRYSERNFKSSKNIFYKDDVIYGKLRPYLDKVIVADENGVCTTEMIPMRCYCRVFPFYLRWALKSPSFINYANNSTHGMNLPRLGTEKARLALIPLPPLNEQKRIVARVEQLRAYCDELEKKKAEREKVRVSLNGAVLEKLVGSRTEGEYRENLRRIEEQFDVLYDNRENVAKLKQAILQLAVMGKLVPQDPEDEPASVLLEKIKQEKERLIKEGKIKEQSPLPPVKEEEKLFDLPRGWEWVRLGNLSKVIEYGTSFKPSANSEGIPIIRMNNIIDGVINYEQLKFVNPLIKDLPKLYLKQNDLLFNRTNSFELVGKTGLFTKESNNYTFASYLIRVTLYCDYLVPLFINIAMNSMYFRETQIVPQITQQCGQANFNGTKLANTIVPIAPTFEQHKIVVEVERLLGLCDRLREGLGDAERTGEKLFESLVQREFGSG